MPWLSRWLDNKTMPPVPGSLLSKFKAGPNASTCPEGGPASTIWSTSWRGIVKRKIGFPSKLFQGRWYSPVLIVLCQAYCKSTCATRAFISILKNWKPKYPPPNKRIVARRRISDLFKLLVFVFWKDKRSLTKEGSLVGGINPCLSMFAQNSP